MGSKLWNNWFCDLFVNDGTNILSGVESSERSRVFGVRRRGPSDLFLVLVENIRGLKDEAVVRISNHCNENRN